jgi:hypothetical protein
MKAFTVHDIFKIARFTDAFCVCIYIYIYIHIKLCVCVCVKTRSHTLYMPCTGIFADSIWQVHFFRFQTFGTGHLLDFISNKLLHRVFLYQQGTVKTFRLKRRVSILLAAECVVFSTRFHYAVRWKVTYQGHCCLGALAG